MKRLAHLALVLTAAGALLAACSRPSDLPDGNVSRTQVDFQAPAAGGNPNVETLYVSNGGRGSLEAPTVAVSYQDGADWLTVTLTSSGDQYAIAVQPITTGLAAGTYRATLTLTWASGSAAPTLVAVTLVVPARTVDPGYQTSVEVVAIDAPRGGGDPAPAAFQVVNAGRGTLPVPSIDVAYVGTATGWLATAVAAASDGYSVTAQARVAGTPSGVHRATLTLRAAGGVVPARTLPVTLTVPPPEVALSSREVALRAPSGGLDVTASLTVANAGGGQLAIPVATVSYDAGSAARWEGLLDVAVSGTPSGYQLTFTAHQVRSTAAGASKLPPGTYTAVVQVSAPGAAVSDTARVTFEVPAPVMQLSSSQVAFSEYTSCPLPAGATVSVTNVGGGALAAPVVAIDPGVDSWLAASVAASGPDAYAVVLTPRAYPPAAAGGPVETTVQITDPTSVASPVPVRVRFDALAPDLAAATVTPSPLNIWAQVGIGDPAPRTVSLRVPACVSGATAELVAADAFDPAAWVSLGAVVSSSRGFDVSVLTSVAGLADGDRRTATLRLGVSGRTWDVTVNLAAGSVAAAGPLQAVGGGSVVLTPLADGRALLTGAPVDQLFDPSTRTWSRMTSSHAGRTGQGAVQLSDGRVLLCGGSIQGQATSACEVLFGNAWASFGTLTRPRSGVVLMELPRSRVLVLSAGDMDSTPEVLDLATGRSTLLTGIGGSAAVKRPDGSILIAGGYNYHASWVYSPARDAWSRSGDLPYGNMSPVLISLRDGRVLAAGSGLTALIDLRTIQGWDPRTGAWSIAPPSPSIHGPFTVLSSGKVLATSGMIALGPGGSGPFAYGNTDLEVFDPATNTWSVVGKFTPNRRDNVAITTLASGMVLLVGGFDEGSSVMSPETFTW